MKFSESLKKGTRPLPLLLGLALACPWTAGAATYYFYASSVYDLTRYFKSADADPLNNYDITLTLAAQPYLLTETLKLTQGRVWLKGYYNNLASAHKYVLDGGFPNRSWIQVFNVTKGPSNYTPYLSINGVTIRGGVADGTAGGAIYVKNGRVSLTNSYVQDNRSTSLGSGVYVEGSGEVTVHNSVIRDNINFYVADPKNTLCGGLMAGGGGLASNGNLMVYRSTVTGNHTCRGGGIAAYNGSYLTVENSTISGNKANLTGGGIFLYGRVGATLAFNTITGNKAGNLSTGGSGFWDEKYGGGIAFTHSEGNLNMRGNILAKNQTVFSDKATLFYHGHDCYDRAPGWSVNRHVEIDDNFIGALANCSMLGSDLWSDIGWEGGPEDPLLDPLSQKTGTAGPQYTHAPKYGSPVIGSFWKSGGVGCPYYDQLGHRRDWYQNESAAPTRCDRGAHQYNWYH